MQIIKIPLSIIIYYFFSLLGLLISILLLDFTYGFYGANYLFVVLISGIIFSVIHIFLLFKYFNDPLKYTNLNMGFIILLLILSGFTISYNGAALFYILFNLFFLFKFFQFKRFMNLEEGEEKDKYVKYVEQKQYKNVFVTYGVVIFSLIIFYFAYYSVPITEFKQIDDSYFENVHKYKDISDEDNGLKALEEYSNHLNSLEYIENKELYNIISEGGKVSDLEFDSKKIKVIDNLRLGIENIINKKAIVDNNDDDFISMQGYSMVSRESIYNVLYYLENGEEIKAIDYLIDNYKIGNMLITSHGNIINFIVGVTIQSITLVELNYILDNYKLSNESLTYLLESFNTLENTKNSYKNIINYEYNNQYNFILNNSLFIDKGSIIFSNKEHFKNGFKNVYYDVSIGKNTTCSQYRNSIEIFTKKNSVSNIMLAIGCIDYGYDKDLENLQIEESDLLNKINLLLSEK